MKNLLFSISILLLTIKADAQIVDIPDPGFKQFLIDEGIDSNGDSEIQISEAEAVEILDINGSDILSIEGIKSFKNLTELRLDITEVTSVDVSGLKNLTLFEDGLSQVNTFSAVDCSALSILNFFNNYDLIDLTGCTALTSFHTYVHINRIYFTNCSALKRIEFTFVGLDELDVTGCTSLTYFKTENLHSNLDFDFTEVPQLDTFIVTGGQSLDLDINNAQNLKFINVEFTSSLIVTECPNLESIIIEYADNIMDLSHLPKLSNLSFWGSFLDHFRMDNCPIFNDFTSTFIEANNLTITNCISITELILQNGIPIETCDFTGMSALREVTLSSGARNTILDGCYSLESFTSQGYNPAIEYDFSNCINLAVVDLGECFDLRTLILQNGSTEMLNIMHAHQLTTVCVDPDEFVQMQSYLSTLDDINPEITVNCGFADGGHPFSVSGTSFLDINNDSCKTSDVTLPYSKYVISDNIIGDLYFYSDKDGNFKYNLPEGQYTFGPELLYGDYIFTSSPENISVDFPVDGTVIKQDFCFIPNPAEVDVIEVHLIPIEVARPGFDTRYLITYTNTGNITRGGDIKLTFPGELMDLVYSYPEIDVQEDGFLSWSFEDLIPYETRKIEFTMNLNSPMDTPPLNGGDILNMKAEVGPLGNQTLTVYWSCLNQEVVNSFDPNDKTCLNGNAFDQELVGDYLKYMIRFENTGTAEAVNIVVTDTLDATKFDLRTLQVINASHEVETELTDNVIKFIFKDIYLPFDDATNDGYVTFKIKTLPTLELGDDIRNKAEIFFDFNFPIVTNTTSTIISDFTSTVDIKNQTFDMDISPNPASEKIFVHAEDQIYQIQIFDISGRLLRGISFIGNKNTYELKIDQLKEGAYFIKAYSENGYSVEKFIKE